MINTRSQRKTLNKGSYMGKPGKVIITSKNTRMLNGKHLEYYTLSSYIDCDEDEEDNMNFIYMMIGKIKNLLMNIPTLKCIIF